MVEFVRMPDQEDERVSDGTDIEVDRGGEEEFLADAVGENELVDTFLTF